MGATRATIFGSADVGAAASKTIAADAARIQAFIDPVISQPTLSE